MPLLAAQVKTFALITLDSLSHTPETRHWQVLVSYIFKMYPESFYFLVLQSYHLTQIIVTASHLVSLLLPLYPDHLKIIFHSHVRWHCPSAQSLMVPRVNAHLHNGVKTLDVVYPSTPLDFSDLISYYPPSSLTLLPFGTHQVPSSLKAFASSSACMRTSLVA